MSNEDQVTTLTNTLHMLDRFKTLFNFDVNDGVMSMEDDDDTDSEEDYETCVKPNPEETTQSTEQTIIPKKVLTESSEMNENTLIRKDDEDDCQRKAVKVCETVVEGDEENIGDFASAENSENEDYYKPDINEYYRKHAGEYKDDPCFRENNGLEGQFIYESLPPLNNINIMSSVTINPTEELIIPQNEVKELTYELEAVSKQNNELVHMCDKYKTDKENSDFRVRQLTLQVEQMQKNINNNEEVMRELRSNSHASNSSNDQVQKLRSENQQMCQKYTEEQTKTAELEKQIEQMQSNINNNEEVIRELRSNSNTSNSNNDQVQKLRSENQQIYQKYTEEQAKTAELEKQIKKLQKYEAIFKRIDLLQINKKLYQVINKIGKGGFSEVLSCVSFEDKKTYALKKSNLKDLDDANRKLVFQETDTLKRLQSTDKVVKLIDHEYIEKKKIYYVLMEMGSCDLSHIFKKEIAKYECVREPMRVFYWTKMLEAVKAVHEIGVVHSDLKPANFVLVNDEVKLIDFNISNVTGDRTSVTVQNECGTIEYMSPDMFIKDETTDGRVGKKLDIWSMGIILWLMVYGKLPLQNIKTFPKKMFAICDPLKKEFVCPPIDNKNLIDVINNCLKHDPVERFSVDQLLKHTYITGK